MGKEQARLDKCYKKGKREKNWDNHDLVLGPGRQLFPFDMCFAEELNEKCSCHKCMARFTQVDWEAEMGRKMSPEEKQLLESYWTRDAQYSRMGYHQWTLHCTAEAAKKGEREKATKQLASSAPVRTAVVVHQDPASAKRKTSVAATKLNAKGTTLSTASTAGSNREAEDSATKQSATKEEGASNKTGLSRKQRKQLAAKLHAESTGTCFTDTVVAEKGSAQPQQQQQFPTRFLPQYVSFPFLDLPLDIVKYCLVHFLNYDSLMVLAEASIPFRLMLNSGDQLWEELFRVWRTKHTARYRALSKKSGALQRLQSMSWRKQIKLAHSTLHDSGVDASKLEAFVTALQSEGSAIIRQELKRRTSTWAEIEQTVYSDSSGDRFLEYPISKVTHQTTPLAVEQYWQPSQRTDTFVEKDFQCSVTKVKKSDLYAHQCACTHHVVKFSKSRFQFSCYLCGVFTHASTERSDMLCSEQFPKFLGMIDDKSFLEKPFTVAELSAQLSNTQ